MANYRVFYKYQNTDYRLYFSAVEVQTEQKLVNMALNEIRKYHEGIAENDISKLEKRVRR
jgi:hypothetical protein